MQGWIPACSPTAHEPLSFQKSASTDPTPGLSSHPIFPRSTSIYSFCGRELGPADKDTSCWSCSSTMQYLQGCPTSSRPFSFSTTSQGASFSLPSTPRSPTVAPSWSFTASSNGLPGSHFSSPARPSQPVPRPQGQRTLLVSPRYFRPSPSQYGLIVYPSAAWRVSWSPADRPHHMDRQSRRLCDEAGHHFCPTSTASDMRRDYGLPQCSCFRIILGLVITAAALLSQHCPSGHLG